MEKGQRWRIRLARLRKACQVALQDLRHCSIDDARGGGIEIVKSVRHIGAVQRWRYGELVRVCWRDERRLVHEAGVADEGGGDGQVVALGLVGVAL